MKLQEGKKYRTRSGLTISPLKIVDNGTNYNFEGSIEEPEFKTTSVRNWKKTGAYLFNGVEHAMDLVEEINQ